MVEEHISLCFIVYTYKMVLIGEVRISHCNPTSVEHSVTHTINVGYDVVTRLRTYTYCAYNQAHQPVCIPTEYASIHSIGLQHVLSRRDEHAPLHVSLRDVVSNLTIVAEVVHENEANDTCTVIIGLQRVGNDSVVASIQDLLMFLESEWCNDTISKLVCHQVAQAQVPPQVQVPTQVQVQGQVQPQVQGHPIEHLEVRHERFRLTEENLVSAAVAFVRAEMVYAPNLETALKLMFNSGRYKASPQFLVDRVPYHDYNFFYKNVACPHLITKRDVLRLFFGKQGFWKKWMA